MMYEVKHLRINYKTLEEFKKFREYGLQELSMLEDLNAKISENEITSPFYGIYLGDSLVARMSLYKRDKKYDQYFQPPQSYIEVWKLEVLAEYQRKGLGKALVEFAKTFNLPIKTSPRVKSSEFWTKMGFVPVTYDIDRDLGENPIVWFPKGVTEQKQTAD
ncbi:N-acetyltransferase [Priestia megaterium]|nr:N-acetyltransferase [Priestia megaterium]